MYLVGKKKKGATTSVAPEPVDISFGCNLSMSAINEALKLDTALVSKPEVEHSIPWYKQAGQDRGVMITPTGSKIYYCQTHNEMNEIRDAKYPNLCIIPFDADNKQLHHTYMSWCGFWVNADNVDKKFCTGPDSCPHVEHMKECDGNSYVDQCNTCDKGNCLIVNSRGDEIADLSDEVDILKDDCLQYEAQIEELKGKIEELENEISDLDDTIAALENQNDEKPESSIPFKKGDIVKLEGKASLHEMCSDGRGIGNFFILGKEYEVLDFDEDDEFYDLCIQNENEGECWTNSRFFKKVKTK